MESKKILISVPLSLLSELDALAETENISRSEFIRCAVKKEIKAFNLKKREKDLKQGYIAMGEINSELAQYGIIADNEQLLTYEQKLSESE